MRKKMRTLINNHIYLAFAFAANLQIVVLADRPNTAVQKKSQLLRARHWQGKTHFSDNKQFNFQSSSDRFRLHFQVRITECGTQI